MGIDRLSARRRLRKRDDRGTVTAIAGNSSARAGHAIKSSFGNNCSRRLWLLFNGALFLLLETSILFLLHV